MKPKLGFLMLCHPYEEGREEAPSLFEKAVLELKKLDLDVVVAEEIVEDENSAHRAAQEFKREDVDVICLVEGTWSSDYLALDILEEVDVPIITWGLPGIRKGSLCGVQQLDYVLKELEKPYKFICGSVEERKAYEKIEGYAKAASLKRILRKTRLGLVGYRIRGMTEVTFDELELKSLLGPRIVHFGLNELKSEMDKVHREEGEKVWKEIKKKVGKINVEEKEGIDSIRAYLVLKKWIEKEALSGLAVECYPDFMGQICLAYSLLGEEGIPGSCEGDVNSLVAMIILNLLTKIPVHNTDLLALYPEDNSIVFSHCGSGAFSLAEERERINLFPVRLANKGTSVLFPAKPGKVTLVNLVGRKDTYRMCIVEGEAVKTEMVFAGNPIKVKFPIPVNGFLDIVAENGFGHHWMIGYGNVREELEDFCRLVDLRYVSM
ncbi:L-arabinose isomerase [subsurface metagenome]